MNRIFTRLVGPTLAISLCLIATSAFAAIPFPFSTTYNCAEQDQNTIGWVTCDGLTKNGDWTTSNGSTEQITSVANFSGGSGGRGQRHWIGDGSNNNSGSIRYPFTSATNEVYVRWYVRWQQGLALATSGGSHKVLYFAGNLCGQSGGCYFLLEPSDIRTTVNGHNFQTNTYGWNALNAGVNSSNGNWNCFEIHVKSETAPGAGNGIAQWWINGILRHNMTNVDFGNPSTGFSGFLLPSNGVFSTVGGTDMYSDIDDVEVSTSRIGCLGNAPPAAPVNLQVN